ncbi:MAG: hypothetical protein ACRCSQ_10575 [Bacteroidales bacterium]
MLLLWGVNIHLFWRDGSYKNRVWLHRTNTPEKLHEFINEYDGFECDILLREDSILDITHDEPVSWNISPDPYFQVLSSGAERHVWFDFKNLNKENVEEVESLFDELVQKYNISKNQLIIEGGDTAALRVMKGAGYYTAYYVPMIKDSRMSANESDSFYKRIDLIANSGAVDALSFYVRQYESIKRYVSNGIDFLTWAHHETKEQLSLFPRGRKLLKDQQVRVILVKDKGNHHK